MRYYLSNNGVVSGPFDEAQLEAWGREGQLDGGMRLATEGTEEWVSIHHTPFAALLPAPKKPSKLTTVVLGSLGLVVTAFALLVCGSLFGRKSKPAVSTSPATESTETVRVTLPTELFSHGGTAVEFWKADSGAKALVENSTHVEQLNEGDHVRPNEVPGCQYTRDCMRRVRLVSGDKAGWIGYVRAADIQARR